MSLTFYPFIYINLSRTHWSSIVVPGRMLHIIAVTSRNLLKLKQIFVRFASHEIRFVRSCLSIFAPDRVHKVFITGLQVTAECGPRRLGPSVG